MKRKGNWKNVYVKMSIEHFRRIAKQNIGHSSRLLYGHTIFRKMKGWVYKKLTVN